VALAFSSRQADIAAAAEAMQLEDREGFAGDFRLVERFSVGAGVVEENQQPGVVAGRCLTLEPGIVEGNFPAVRFASEEGTKEKSQSRIEHESQRH